jgi:REP element-mobilizing transposase RayT
MARLARVVATGLPHHITQRGNRRQQTLFCADAGRPESLVADLFGQANGLGPALDHPPGVDAVHGLV